ncbi:MAG: hypothetical protein NT118_15125 [Lentisphaerae bacterium]|nr:hypothetical protein [Lentisphaerota bacterium]
MSTNKQNKEIGNLPKENSTAAAGKLESQKCEADHSGQGLAAADAMNIMQEEQL